MKFWVYLIAKLAVAGAVVTGLWAAAALWLPRRTTILHSQQEPFAHDLTYTTVMMLFFLLCTGLIYIIAWDQRYRCRTCLRRLRMPMHAGSWPNMFLKGQPRMEYICIYGHGTLKVPEVEFTGTNPTDWKRNDDIWTELESLEAGPK